VFISLQELHAKKAAIKAIKTTIEAITKTAIEAIIKATYKNIL
jgi:hypothetical protein